MIKHCAAAVTAALAVAGLLAGCGSTAQLTGSSASGGLNQGGGTGPQASTAPGQPQANHGVVDPTTGPANQPGTVNSRNGGGSGTVLPGGPPTTSGTGNPAAAPAIPVKGKGWDAKNVYIGIATENDLTTAFHAAGFAGLDTGDAKAKFDAIIADINNHGGVLGRHVVPLYKDTPTKDGATAAQAVCTYFTQDHQVIGVYDVATIINQDNLNTCLKKAHTPVLYSVAKIADDQYEQKYAPYWYSFTTASYDNISPVWVKRLVATGYFTGWDTTNSKAGTAEVILGTLYANRDVDQRIFKKLGSLLAASGHPVAKEVVYDDTSTQNQEAAINSAVLTFRNAHVTHVFLDGTTSALLFLEAAEQQHFYPRYGMNSSNLPAILLAPNIPTQMVGTMGIGWLPGADVNGAQDPGSLGASQARCIKEMKDNNIDISGRSAQLAAYVGCDMIRLPVEAAVAGNGFDYQSLHTGVAALGSNFQSAAMFASGFAANRYEVAGGVRDFGWDTGCKCLRYLSRTTYRI